MSPNVENEIDAEFEAQEAEEARHKAEALKRLTEARVIIQEACNKAWPLIDDDFLRDNYEVDSTGFIVLMVKSWDGDVGRIWPSEEQLISDV